MVVEDGGGGAVIAARDEAFGPDRGAAGRIESSDVLAGPYNELPLTSGGDRDGRTVEHRFIERLPDDVPRILVERQHRGTGFGAGEEDEEIALDQRGGAAHHVSDGEFVIEQLLPEHGAGGGIETVDFSVNSEYPDSISFNDWRGGG